MRPYITDVKSNIQGGVKASIGPKTLIVGSNMIGKSTIVRAIELATTGRASDVAGRDTLALDAELWSLAGPGVEIASASALYSDGEPLSAWTLQHGKKAKRVGRTAIFPLRDVRSAILGSPETARKFFLSVAKPITWDDVLAELPPQFHKRMEPYKTSDGATGLLAAIEGTRKRTRDLNSEAKGHRESARIATQGLSPPASPAEIEAAKNAAANEKIRAQQVWMKARIATLAPLSQVADEKFKIAKERLDLAYAAMESFPEGAIEVPPIFEQAITLVEEMVKTKADVCAICGTKVGTNTFERRLEVARARIQGTLDLVKARRAAASEVKEASFAFGSAEGDLRPLVDELNGLRAQLSAIGTEELAAPIGNYEDLIRTAERWESARAAEGRAAQLEAEATINGQLTTLLSTALERLLEKSREAFERAVQEFLPESMRFGVELKDGNRDVFRIGLRSDDMIRTALSGAEWATVTSAVAAAVVKGTKTIGPDDPVIIVPEDRDFDPDTLASVMEKFNAVDGQVILTGTKKSSRPIEGWTVIELGETIDELVTSVGAPDFCVQCNKMIESGECKHGVKGRTVEVSSKPKSIEDLLR